MIININSVTSVNGRTGAVDGVVDAKAPQTLTETEKAQARQNINAAATEGNFTLLETITLSEDTASISRTGYNYTDMLFRFTMPVADTAKTWTGQYQFSGGSVAWFNATARTAGPTKINFRVKCEGGLMFCDYGRSDAATPQNLTNIPSTRPAGWMGGLALSKITSFKLGFYESTIPSGTTIEIFAR